MLASTPKSCATSVLLLSLALFGSVLVAPRADAVPAASAPAVSSPVSPADAPGSPTAGTTAGPSADTTAGPTADPTADPTPTTTRAATAAAPRPSLCDQSYSGLVPHNSLEDIRAGYYTGPPYARFKVANGSNVDWTLDPYGSLTWRMWLDTLGWAGPLILSYDRTGNTADLELAMAYARDYVTDQPMDASTPDRPVLQQSSRRLQFLSCLYERSPRPWIAEAMEGTVDFLAENWAGLYNHGLDQDQAIVVAGCVLERDDWIALGRERLSKILEVSIDGEGATNEQSGAYAKYTYNRWVAAETVMSTCGLPPLPGLASRLEANYTFVAHVTRPDGILTPIGDTYPTDRGHGPHAGTPLSQVWVQNGWAFGRSSWAAEDDPTHYSLRFGPRRQLHGHADHGSVTYYANGSPVITEPGSIGYTDPRRVWYSTAAAKNVLLVGTNACSSASYAKLLASTRTPTYDRYVVQTPHCQGVLAQRAVTYARSTGVLTVDDFTTAQSRAEQRQQLWHLVPGTTVAVKRVDGYRTVVRLTMPNGSTADLVASSIRRGASARAALALDTAKRTLADAQAALRKAVRSKAPAATVRARKRAVAKARTQVTTTQRRATQLEDRAAPQVSVVTGRTNPYQGWVSGGPANPVAAPVVIVSQSARAANLRTTITPG